MSEQVTPGDERDELIAGLRADAGDYGRMKREGSSAELLSWDQTNVRAWEAADALESLSVSPPAEVEVTDDTAEQATLYGYQAVWDEAKFDADPVKNAWMWQRVQIAVKAAVARALGAVTPGEGKGQ